ncbi:MAG TPA: gamma-glutamyltransferase family protein [Thermomicrobiales bacterium]|nr:gamma-glutamyltransferase family protein [Thermomicrobiales bacterium]
MTLGFPTTAEWKQRSASSGTRRPSPVIARNGIVASAHPLISATGLGVLQQGGNAVDAAVAASLVGGVVLPAMCGLGGDLFAVVHGRSRAGKTETLAFHGSGVGPSNATVETMRARGDRGGAIMAQFGPLSPSVPGYVDGCFALLDRFGSRSFAELAQPAIRYASEGVALSPLVTRWIAETAGRLREQPATAAVFLPGGDVPAVGTPLRQPDLARSLQAIADGGRDVFHAGELAERICAALAAQGGLLSLDDFAGHATDVSAPIATTYRDHVIYETTLPTQGFVVNETLNIVEHADLAGMGLSSATAVHLLAESLGRAFADRNAYAGDPRCVDVPLDVLLSKKWAARRWGTIDPARAATDIAPGRLSPGDTTFLCVVDGDGMMISLIFSLSEWFGSRVVAGDTGILLNNRAGHCFSLVDGHPNQFAPGKRPMHTLNCWLIAGPDGAPLVAGGTPGGDFQPQWNVQTIAGLIDAGLDVQRAVEQPRWQIWPATYPADLGNPLELRVEDRLGEATIAALERMGHRIVRAGDWGAGGSAQVIARDPATGVLAGGSDPRSEGLAIGY